MIEARQRWRPLDGERSYFESDWKPDSWSATYRFLFVRRKVQRQVKGPLQLDLFEPRDIDNDYRVVVTNQDGFGPPRSPLPLRSRLSGRDLRGGQETCRAGLDSHPALTRQSDRHLVRDDGAQPRPGNADARPAARRMDPDAERQSNGQEGPAAFPRRIAESGMINHTFLREFLQL